MTHTPDKRDEKRMELWLLRHGQTEGNLRDCYNGRLDEPLCPEGIAEAVNAGARPEITHVFVSPLLRARQTARILFPNAEQTVIDGLREMDFGDFEGHTAEELRDDPAFRKWVDSRYEDACPNGESIPRFAVRIRSAFLTAVDTAREAGEERMIIVAHGGTLMAVMWMYTDTGKTYFDWFAPNCKGYRAMLDLSAWDDAPKLLSPVAIDRVGDLV